MNKIIFFCRSNINFFVFITLLIASGLFSHLLTNDYSIDGGRKQIALSGKLLLALSYVLSTGILIIFWREVKQKFTPVAWVWLALVVWTIVSVLIGQFNMHTVMRLIGFVGCTLVGLMLFVCKQNVRQVVMQLFWICFAILAINIFYIDLSVLADISARYIKGVFVQKNLLGHVSFLAMFVNCFFLFSKRGAIRWVGLLVLIVAAWLLFLSTSMTSNLLIPIAALVVLASLIVERYQRGWIIISGVTVFFSGLLVLYWGDFFALIGKSTTFTGRIYHWNVYWTLIEQQMLTGHGYGAYPSSQKQTYWLTAGPHNGFIELIYYIGAIGALMMSLVIGLSLKNWWGIAKAKALILDGCFLISFLAVFLALNLMETYMLNRSGLFWPLFVYTTLQLAFLNKQYQIDKGSV